MVEAESEVVLLPSFVFASMIRFDNTCGGATLWWLVLPDWAFFRNISRPAYGVFFFVFFYDYFSAIDTFLSSRQRGNTG